MSPGPSEAKRRSKPAAFVPLAIGIVVATLVWGTATETTTITRRVVGGGTGHFETASDTTNLWLAGIAFAILAMAVGVWFALHPDRSGRNKLMDLSPTVAAIVLLPLIGCTFIVRGQREDISFEERERYRSTQAVLDAIANAGIDCTNPRSTARDTDYWTASETTCDIATPAAIEDGVDSVIIDMWLSDESRVRWMEAVPHEDVFAVFGPTWLIRCEFEADCAQIQAGIGGRNY
jgi:hypothetical protein